MGLMDKFSAEVNRACEEFKELIGKAPEGSSQNEQVSQTIYVGNNVRYVSPENCQNCGAQLGNNDLKFCPECGTELELIRICTKCGTRVQEDDEFCPECGAELRLARACANCGTRVQEDDEFCPECGTPLKGQRTNRNIPAKRNKNVVIIGIIAVVLIIFSAGFYFLYWTKTPVYSINIIKEAVQKKDVYTFEKHVDMDTLYGKIWDKITAEQMKGYHDKQYSDAVVRRLLTIRKNAKASEIATLKRGTIKRIKGDFSIDSDDDALVAVVYDSYVFSKDPDVKEIEKGKDTALVSSKIYSLISNRDMVIRLKMRRLSDGSWRVEEWTNFWDFMNSTK